ncbi:hypothetical protein FHT82_003711 [Rhizobium sp. BK275]|nr:hypothetical protein [Rhizobium sp. BK275]MBB3406279.1 hypothetical protein [Rhizobium sp. BK316]
MSSVEAYDYRTKHGFIERHEFGSALDAMPAGENCQ